MDSGASDDICNTGSAFHNLQTLPSPVSILLGDCLKAFGIGQGEISLDVGSGLVLLFTALYALAFSISLLSISQLPAKYSLIFQGNTCFIVDRNSSSDAMKLAIRENDLFRLRVLITYLN